MPALLPYFALVVNALVWGLSWWPFRQFQEAGLHPLWTTVLLYAHHDVQPVGTPDRWSSDPFTLRADGSRLYGRGTSDMKGFLACVLAALPAMAEARLTTPILLALILFADFEAVPLIADAQPIGDAAADPAAEIRIGAAFKAHCAWFAVARNTSYTFAGRIDV